MTPLRLALLCCSLLLAGLLLRPVQAENGGDSLGAAIQTWKFDRQVEAFREGVATVDSTGAASVLSSGTEFVIGGRKNLPLSGRFTTAAATVKVRLYYYWSPDSGTTNYFLGCSDEITLTASGVQDGDGLYAAPTWVFSGMGAWSCYLVVTEAPSSGTVDFWLGSF